MDKGEYKRMCQAHGLRMVSDIRAVGFERGYFVSVQYAGKKDISLNLPVGKNDAKAYSADLKASLREAFGKNASAAWADGGYVTVFLNSDAIPDVYCQGVVAVLDILRQLGFAAPDACGVCGKSGCDCAIPRGPAYAPAHRACLENGVAGAEAARAGNMRSGSYLLGAVGAFLGALVGVLPTVVTVLALERIYVLLFTLIPLASYAGYKLLKGKMNYMALLFTVIFSVLSVYLLNMGMSVYYLAVYYELSIQEGLSLFSVAISDAQMWIDITKSEDFLKCILFVALGIFLAWGQISRTAKSAVKDARGVLDSAVPYGRTDVPEEDSGTPGNEN